MASYVYLIKKNNCFMIGKAKNIDNEMRKIRPDQIIASLLVEHPAAFEARLLRRYSSTRLPGSSYFQFSDKELIDCKKQFGVKSKIPKKLGDEFFITLTGSIIIFTIACLLSFYFAHKLFFSLGLSLFLCSFPMWLLFFLGNFGGYNNNDLSLFSSWFNRIRALILAISLSVTAFILFGRLIIWK